MSNYDKLNFGRMLANSDNEIIISLDGHWMRIV